MAINPVALKSFIRRKRRNSDRAKSFTPEAIDRKIDRLDPKPDFVLEPYHHQKVCFLLALEREGYFLLPVVGLGKTKIVLDVLRYRMKLGQVKRSLILVPGAANVGGWENEIRKHAPDVTAGFLFESMGKDAREAVLVGDSQLVVMTYMAWLSFVCRRVKGKRGKKRKMEVDRALAAPLEAEFDAVVMDESAALKNWTSVTFSACRRFARSIRYRYCMSATPFNRDPQELWSQFFVVDHGEALGESLGLFREAMFKPVKNRWSGWPDWKFDRKKEAMLYDWMKHCSIRWTEEECLDLPPKIGGIDNPTIRSVPLPKEAHRYYEEASQELIDAQHGRDYKLMENSYFRMRMIFSGYLPVRDDAGEKRYLVFARQPKMDALVELLEELGDDKVIVFHIFKKTGALIAKRMQEEKITADRLYGDTRDKADVMRRFTETDDPRVLVASRSGIQGLNLHARCRRTVFFETPDDPAGRIQAEGRTHRAGQTRACFYYDLVARGTLDERILWSAREGARLIDLLIDGKGIE